MLFNSYEYMFLFLPLVALVYFRVLRTPTAGALWLVAASLWFYGWWRVGYLPVLVVSALVNYWVGTRLGKLTDPRLRRWFLIGGLAWNLLLLGYFKYTNFLIENWNALWGTHTTTWSIILPLGISFFTFQKIGYLVDCYKGIPTDYTFTHYLLFVSFFPQLIAGPIVHHRQIISQFKMPDVHQPRWDNIAAGVFTFVLGLSKKVIIADMLSGWATKGFDQLPELNFVQGWVSALAYTLQLYFDFSGYTDMAIGSALIFNIRLPENFLSPYQSSNISEFWRRWHATLGRFLRDYVYIPLGGNRRGGYFQARNLILTFLIGGLWHGAAWSFVLWGAWHGIGVTVQAIWERSGRKLPRRLGMGITFLFVMIGWVFFRATHWRDALKVLKAMAGFIPSKFTFWQSLKYLNSDVANSWETMVTLITLIAALSIVWFWPNTLVLRERLQPKPRWAWGLSLLLVLSLIHLRQTSEFLYFNF